MPFKRFLQADRLPPHAQWITAELVRIFIKVQALPPGATEPKTKKDA